MQIAEYVLGTQNERMNEMNGGSQDNVDWFISRMTD